MFNSQPIAWLVALLFLNSSIRAYPQNRVLELDGQGSYVELPPAALQGLKEFTMIPLGINLELFRPRPMNMGCPCIFGTAGRFSGPGARKNMHGVLSAFQAAFLGIQDVRLVIKCYPDCPLPRVDDPRSSASRLGVKPDK